MFVNVVGSREMSRWCWITSPLTLLLLVKKEMSHQWRNAWLILTTVTVTELGKVPRTKWASDDDRWWLLYLNENKIAHVLWLEPGGKHSNIRDGRSINEIHRAIKESQRFLVLNIVNINYVLKILAFSDSSSLVSQTAKNRQKLFLRPFQD